MAQRATERIVWAVEKLNAQPEDEILEIGCGHGVAVSLVCEALTSGTIVAIDRSQTMIDMAERRNQPFVDAGKATFQCTTLEKADFGTQRFDKIFAIRVNFFIQQPAAQLPLLKKLLKPHGALYLFNDPPGDGKTQIFTDDATHHLKEHGFAIKEVSVQRVKAAQLVCIVAVAE